MSAAAEHVPVLLSRLPGRCGYCGQARPGAQLCGVIRRDMPGLHAILRQCAECTSAVEAHESGLYAVIRSVPGACEAGGHDCT